MPGRPRTDARNRGADRIREQSGADGSSSTAVLWRRLDQPGHDVVRVVEGPGGVVIEGTALFEEGGEPCRLDYRVLCDGQWRTRLATVSGWWGLDTVNLEIAVDAAGQWTLDGEPCPDLTGCVDVDLSFTPATNVLPIRRLALAEGARAEVRAAWLRFPECTLEPLDQVYARTADRQYHYETAGGDFTATLATDGHGVVVHYSGLWQREPAE